MANMVTFYKYAPGEADLYIAQAWLKMTRDGDVGDMLLPGSQTLSGFLGILQAPHQALYAQDERGIWFLTWFQPMLSGLDVGLWLAREQRRTKQGLMALLESWERALTYYPCLTIVTKQTRLMHELERLGWAPPYRLHGAWVGEDAWGSVLTWDRLTKALYQYRRAFRLIPAEDEEEVVA